MSTTTPRTRRSILRTDRGVVIPLTAMLLVAIMTSVAFAVDLGRLSLERRDKQADADVLSFDLIRFAVGVTEQQILDDPDYHSTLARSADANGIDLADITVVFGQWDEATEAFVDTPPSAVPDAVHVTARGHTKYFFARAIGFTDGETERTGMAAYNPIADLFLGTRAAAMRSGDSDGLAALLKTLFGDDADFDLTVGGYQGLLTTNVTLDDIAAELGFGSAEEMMAADITASEFAEASARAFSAKGEDNNAEFAQHMADVAKEHEQEFDNPPTFKFEDLIDAEFGGDEWGKTKLNFFDLFVSSVKLINGQNFVQTCNDLDPGPTTLTGLTLQVCNTTIDAGKNYIGPVGGEFRTAQVDIVATAEADVAIPLGLGLPTLTGRMKIPLTMGAAGAMATLTAIRCDRATDDHRTDTWIDPQPIEPFYLGSADLNGTPEFILTDNAGLVTVTVNADKNLTNSPGDEQPILDHWISDVRDGPGSTPSLLLTLTTADIDVDIQTALVGVNSSVVEAVLVPALNLMLTTLGDEGTELFKDMGIGLTESDLLLNDVLCGVSPTLIG